MIKEVQPMEINFKHKIGDVVYIYQDSKIFKVVIKEIDVKINSDGVGYTYKVECENLENDCLLKYHWYEDEEVCDDINKILDIIEVL